MVLVLLGCIFLPQAPKVAAPPRYVPNLNEILQPTDKQQDVIDARTHGLQEYKGRVFSPPVNDRCPRGHTWNIHRNVFKLHGLLTSVEVHVQDYTCSDHLCQARRDWTGCDQAIYRFSPLTGFTFELFQGYLADVKDASNPAVYTFWKRRMEQHRSHHVPFATIDTFQAATWTLFKGLKLDFAKEFTCETCGTFETAPILIIDAKALVCKPGKLHEETVDAKRAGTLLNEHLSQRAVLVVSCPCVIISHIG